MVLIPVPCFFIARLCPPATPRDTGEAIPIPPVAK